jgi:hypothetical protein
MAVKRNAQINAKVVSVATKANHRRPVPKTYSYRYEVGADAGPAGDPIVRAGAAIIEGRYRGRAASWNVGRSMIDETTYLAKGSYVHPLEENSMAYPPRHLPAEVKHARTPGFATSAAQKIVRPPLSRIDSNVPPVKAAPGPAAAPDAMPAPQIGATARRDARRPTPANEPAYRKTG